MIILIKKEYYKILLALCLLVLLLVNSYELTFLIWSLTAFVSLRYKYSIHFTKYIILLSIVLLLSFFSSFYSNYKLYNFFRDIAYLLKPILGLLIGYNICKIVGKKIIYSIINIGVIIAIIHLIILGVSFVFFGIKDLNDLRAVGGYFNDYEVYVLILLIFRKKFNIEISNKNVYLYILILSISTIFYFARTNILQFLILFLAMKGYYRLTAKSIKVISISLIIVLSSYAAIYYSNPVRQGKGIEAFLYKIKIAPIEAFKTKINQDDWKEFNDNYRSFENIITVKQVTSQGAFTIIFGEGLGSTIDIGREMWTNDGEFIRYVPTLHNAYMTIFLKSGLLGVFLTLIFIYFLFKQNNSDNFVIKNINYLLVGSAVFLIFSNWVFMGLYLKLDNKSIFLGFLLAYKELFLKENQSQISQNAT
jgi:hypothetical protein